MSDATVGIGVAMHDGVSGVAPGVARSIREVTEANQHLAATSADMAKLTKEIKGYTEAFNTLGQLQRANQQRGGGGGGGGAGHGGAGRGGGRGGVMAQIQRMASGAGGVFGGDPLAGMAGAARAGGEGIQAAGSEAAGVEGMAGLAKGLGIAGAIIAGIAALTGIVIKTSKAWETFLPSLRDLTASMGNASNETDAFVTNFAFAAKAATSNGYSAAQGIALATNLAKTGGGGPGVIADAEGRVFGAANVGLDIGMGTRLAAYGLRGFGMDPNVMYGGFQGSVLGRNPNTAGRINDYAEMFISNFEDSLSRGVEKNPQAISQMSNWLWGGGKVYQGQHGTDVMGILNQSVAGATGLSSQKDAMLYRAARSIAGSNAGMLDVLELEQGGMTGQMMNALRKQIKQQTGGSKTDEIMMFMQATGLGVKDARRLWALGDVDTLKQYPSETPSKAIMDTREGRYMADQEQVKASLAEIAGATTFMAVSAGMHTMAGWTAKTMNDTIDKARAEADHTEAMKRHTAELAAARADAIAHGQNPDNVQISIVDGVQHNFNWGIQNPKALLK